MSAIFLEFLHPPPPYQQYFCRISWQFWPIFDPSSLPIAKVVNGRPLKHTIYDKLNLSLPGQNGILVKFVAYSFIYCMYVVCTFITKLFIKIPPSANKVILGNEFSAWRNFKIIFLDHFSPQNNIIKQTLKKFIWHIVVIEVSFK